MAPSTINVALAAATSLLDSRGLRAPAVRRVEPEPRAPRSLSREQLRALQRETDRLASGRDRALLVLLMLTGLRIGELAGLDADDVRLTQRTGELVIRHGKGDRRRVVPLSRPARAALREWIADRGEHPSGPDVLGGPLWLSRTGARLSVRSISNVVAEVMRRAGLEESAHALRLIRSSLREPNALALEPACDLSCIRRQPGSGRPPSGADLTGRIEHTMDIRQTMSVATEPSNNPLRRVGLAPRRHSDVTVRGPSTDRYRL